MFTFSRYVAVVVALAFAALNTWLYYGEELRLFVCIVHGVSAILVCYAGLLSCDIYEGWKYDAQKAGAVARSASVETIYERIERLGRERDVLLAKAERLNEELYALCDEVADPEAFYGSRG